MRKRSRRSEQFRRAGAPLSEPAVPMAPRWHDGAWLPMLSAVLLTLAFAPISQFYFAWFGLVPFLLFVRRATTTRRLFLGSWAAGTLFFGLNIWWLGFVTVPGTLGSFLYMGLYWALAAVVMRAAWGGGEDRGSRIEDSKGAPPSILHPLSSVLSPFLLAAIWTGCEWVRGNLGTGWPWSFLGYTQTPLLAMCQVADVTGVYGVTFWIVAVNALGALLVIHRRRARALLAPAAAVGAMLAVFLAYGVARIAQTRTTPGPRVTVVQSNFPQSNTGRKGATIDELVAFHVNTTRNTLAAERAAGRTVDLVAWSETMMPTINKAARDFTRGSELGLLLEDAYQELASLTFDFRTALLTGGSYAGKMTVDDGMYVDLDRRNAAYFFEPTGTMSDLRYDKVHLVPFGEYVPFQETIPPLYRFFMWFSPYDYDYNLVPGKWESLTVFALNPSLVPTSAPATAPIPAPATQGTEVATTRPAQPASRPAAGPSLLPASPSRFVVPICFEDADPRLVAAMFRPEGSRARKRADFIVNITNDGWFSQPQLSQHLQIARFRSIENRVPTARSVNTGISAFVDSVGRVTERLPAHVEGTLTSTLSLDPRVSLYTRLGDWFAVACTGATAIVAIVGIARSRRRRAVGADAAA